MFTTESTLNGRTSQSGVIIISDGYWSLEDRTWTAVDRQAPDVGVFSADRFWGLIPFDAARLQEETEEVNGVATEHYVLDTDADLSFETLAGPCGCGSWPRVETDASNSRWTRRSSTTRQSR